MKNNNQENHLEKNMQENSTKENNSYDIKDFYFSANNFYNKDEIDKKYKYYLSAFNKEAKPNLNEISYIPKKNEQLEKLLEEEKNIEDENIQRLKELRNKYLSSVKNPEEEKYLHNYFSKNTSYEIEENKLWKISYPKKEILNTNSRNSFDNINQNQINSSSSNNDISINKLNKTSNNNLDINMSIYERKNNQNENQSFNTYNTYKFNNSDVNKSEDFIKIPKYENNDLILLNNYKNLENDYNKLQYEYNILKNEYMDLVNKYNMEKYDKEEFMNKKDAYNEYIMKEKEELKNINSNYDYILTSLINYVNDIDYIIDKNNLKKIDIMKLKKNIKSLFPNNNSMNTKEHPLYPFLKLLQNYKNVIYNNENIKNLNQNVDKNSQKKRNNCESLLGSYNIRYNVNNIKFKSLNSTKNKISKSIVATPNNYKNDKIQKIFSNRKNLKFFKSEKILNKSKNKTNSATKTQSIMNTSVPKEAN